METKVIFLFYLAQFFLESEMFQTKVVEKIKTHILVWIYFFNRAVYETMWKYFADPGRPQIKIWRMRIPCWISMATSTHTQNM
jgi:hypothetical protein